MTELIGLFDCKNEYECCDKWYKIMREVGLETNLHKLGISTDSDIQRIVSNVNIQRLKNNPVAVTEKMLYRILNEEKAGALP